SRWGGMGGMLGGLLVGGLIGSLLFGGGHGFGGIGLMEILIVGGLIWLAVSFLRRRQQQPAAPSGYAAPDDARNWAPTPAQYTGTGPTTMEAPADLERGITNIRQMDPDFDLKRVADAGSDISFKRQPGVGRQPDRAGEVRGVLDVRAAGWPQRLPVERHPTSLRLREASPCRPTPIWTRGRCTRA